MLSARKKKKKIQIQVSQVLFLPLSKTDRKFLYLSLKEEIQRKHSPSLPESQTPLLHSILLHFQIMHHCMLSSGTKGGYKILHGDLPL